MEIKVNHKEGWVCPVCKKVNAPDVKQCPCVKVEDTDQDNRKLLNE